MCVCVCVCVCVFVRSDWSGRYEWQVGLISLQLCWVCMCYPRWLERLRTQFSSFIFFGTLVNEFSGLFLRLHVLLFLLLLLSLWSNRCSLCLLWLVFFFFFFFCFCFFFLAKFCTAYHSNSACSSHALHNILQIACETPFFLFGLES